MEEMTKFEVGQLAQVATGKIGEVVRTSGYFFNVDFGSYVGTFHASELERPSSSDIAEHDARKDAAEMLND